MVKNKPKISSIDLAYIAGFFDGEGCIHGWIRSKGKYPIIRITISQKRTEILYWLEETLKMGRVCIRPNNRCSYWIITGKKNIKKFISLVLPYCKVKKEELIVGQRLNNLTGEGGDYIHIISEDNLRKRMILYDQLKLLKKKGEYNNDKKE